jgi:hypothetical protein
MLHASVYKACMRDIILVVNKLKQTRPRSSLGEHGYNRFNANILLEYAAYIFYERSAFQADAITVL